MTTTLQTGGAFDLALFFRPRSVAIVGASRDHGKVGFEILKNIKDGGFPGSIFPVNPKAGQIEGLPCFPDLRAIGQTPDLVVVVVPAAAVAGVVRACAAIHVKAVIIITAGFKEVGAEGARLEQEVRELARQHGIRLLGPNCLGIIVPGHRLNASFGGDLPEAGKIAYVSQSGALLASILDLARAGGIGFSALASIGNKADLDELDLLRALEHDDRTHVIAGYLESIEDGAGFVRAAERISREKPILLLKSGGTGAGARAASSHTGSLAGAEMVYDTAFERSGVIRCESIKTQFDYAQALAGQPLPSGPAVAVITNAGGPGIMAADAVEREGLVFAELGAATIEGLTNVLPPAANVRNPVDVLGDALADRYEAALDLVLADPGVDGVLVLLTPQAMTQADRTAEATVRASRQQPGKPVFACFLGADGVAQAHGLLRAGGIPHYDSPESAVHTIRVLAEYVRWRQRPQRVVRMYPANRHRVERILDRSVRRGQREVGELEAKQILEAYGFATPKGAIATTAIQAADLAEQIGLPVVLKIWSPDIVHKSDVGGVSIDLASRRAVLDAFDLMMYRIPQKQPDARILGVLVQQMVRGGREVILGMSRDPQFGPVLMFGMGGIFVEALKDVSFHLAPLTDDEARQMLASTKTFRMLEGVRGQEGVDLEAIVEALQRLSQLVTEFPRIRELDINPFVVGPPGTRPIAVDARLSVEGSQP